MQPVPKLEYSFREYIFPNIQPESLLVQLEAINSGSITSKLGGVSTVWSSEKKQYYLRIKRQIQQSVLKKKKNQNHNDFQGFQGFNA